MSPRSHFAGISAWLSLAAPFTRAPSLLAYSAHPQFTSSQSSIPSRTLSSPASLGWSCNQAKQEVRAPPQLTTRGSMRVVGRVAVAPRAGCVLASPASAACHPSLPPPASPLRSLLIRHARWGVRTRPVAQAWAREAILQPSRALLPLLGLASLFRALLIHRDPTQLARPRGAALHPADHSLVASLSWLALSPPFAHSHSPAPLSTLNCQLPQNQVQLTDYHTRYPVPCRSRAMQCRPSTPFALECALDSPCKDTMVHTPRKRMMPSLEFEAAPPAPKRQHLQQVTPGTWRQLTFQHNLAAAALPAALLQPIAEADPKAALSSPALASVRLLPHQPATPACSKELTAQTCADAVAAVADALAAVMPPPPLPLPADACAMAVRRPVARRLLFGADPAPAAAEPTTDDFLAALEQQVGLRRWYQSYHTGTHPALACSPCHRCIFRSCLLCPLCCLSISQFPALAYLCACRAASALLSAGALTRAWASRCPTTLASSGCWMRPGPDPSDPPTPTPPSVG